MIYWNVLSMVLLTTHFIPYELWSGTDKETIWLMSQRYSTCSLRKRSKGFSNSSILFLSFSYPYFGMVTRKKGLVFIKKKCYIKLLFLQMLFGAGWSTHLWMTMMIDGLFCAAVVCGWGQLITSHIRCYFGLTCKI